MNKKETLNDEEMIFIASMRGHSIDSYNKRKGTNKYRVRINDREREMLNNHRSMQAHITELKIDKSKFPKILIFDIETSPLSAYVWGRFKQLITLDQTISEWFMLSWSAKWLNNPNMMSDVLTPEEALREDDSRITKSMWQLFNEADIVLAHNACVQKDTPILMQDLTWKKAGDLVDGDKVVGFEEGLPPGTPYRTNGQWNNPLKGRGRVLKAATVTSNRIEKMESLKVTLSNGDEIITTHDHPWLAKTRADNYLKWINSENLEVGYRVTKMCSPWDKDESYEAGWLSGFIAGEGSLLRGRKTGVSSIQFCQRPTIVQEQAVDCCDALSIPFFKYTPKDNWGLGRGDTDYFNTLGGKWRTFRILGELEIKRLISNIKWDCEGGLYGQKVSEFTESEEVTVVSVEPCGQQEIAVLSTDTRTYIAGGYAMHNCNFDTPKLNSRFIINGLTPPTPYRQIDTLQVARKEFGFSSNKLDALAGYFGIEHKSDTDFNLWKRCLAGEQEALDYMEAYNMKDVEILEQVYLKLRPWIKNHPNISLYLENEDETCPHCGSTNLADTGTFSYTNVSKFSNVRCLDCGGMARRRTSDYPKEKRKSLVVSV